MPRDPRLLIKDPIIWTMIVLLIICNVGVIWIFTTIYEKVQMTQLREQTFAVRLMQVTLGMVIGLSTTFLGVVVTWFGVTETFGAEFEKPGGTKAKLAAAGPGAILVLCGTFLIYLCIEKEFIIYDTKPIPYMPDIPQTGGNDLPS